MKYKPYPSYKDSGVEWLGQLPEGWDTVKLKHVVEASRPITYGIVQAGADKDDGIPYIRPADMSEENGVIDPEAILRTTNEIASNYARSMIKTGDIICSIGPSFGKVMITPDWLNGGNLTQGTARVAIGSSHNTRYYFWTLRSLTSFAQWEASVGGATFRALNLGPLANTSAFRPTKLEQTAIATFLDRETVKLDTLIAKQEKLIELLLEKRQAIISHAVTKGLDPDVKMKDSGVEWLGKVPAHWKVKPLKHIVLMKSGDQITSESINEHGEYPVYGGNGLRGFTSNFTHDGHYPLIGRQGALCGNINYAKGKFWASEHAVVVSPKINFSVVWLAELLRVMNLGQYSITAAQPGLSVEVIGNLRVPYPALNEQEEITNYINQEIAKIDFLIHKANRSIELAKEHRTALISAAVTGKIDVRDIK